MIGLVHPLHLAVQNVYTEMIKALLEHGANPNIENKHHKTPLVIAVERDKIDLVKVLLEHGANPNIAADSILSYCGANEKMTNLLLEYGALDLQTNCSITSNTENLAVYRAAEKQFGLNKSLNVNVMMEVQKLKEFFEECFGFAVSKQMLKGKHLQEALCKKI